MAKLLLEYQRERDDNISTQQRIVNLHTKKMLAAKDIIYLDSSNTNIALVDDLLMEIVQVIGELQTFLE